MENFIEFKKRVRRIYDHRKHKIRNSIGIYDGYKYYRKNKPKNKEYILTESQYFSITRLINNLLAEEIIRGNDVKLPARMGIIEIRKYDRNIRIDTEGKVHTNLPIDWDRTLELWYKDEESYKDKTLVRLEEQEIFKICYNKDTANYNNKVYYEFVFNKDMKTRFKQRIKEGLVDALYIGRRK